MMQLATSSVLLPGVDAAQLRPEICKRYVHDIHLQQNLSAVKTLIKQTAVLFNIRPDYEHVLFILLIYYCK